MATYKKRSKSKVDKPGVGNNVSSTKQVFESLDQGASKTEIFINKYQKLLIGLISGIVVVFVLYFGYDKLIYQPKVDESNAELFTAQKYFNLAVEAAETSDSLYNLSLNGADGKYGFLDIIEDYSGTPAANISNYSAGIAYFNLKKYDLQMTLKILYEFVKKSWKKINQLEDVKIIIFNELPEFHGLDLDEQEETKIEIILNKVP